MGDATTLEELSDEQPADLHLPTVEFEAWVAGGEK